MITDYLICLGWVLGPPALLLGLSIAAQWLRRYQLMRASWFRADHGVYKDAGKTPAQNGDKVEQWVSYGTGNRRALVQVRKDNQPTYITDPVTGRNYLWFFGDNPAPRDAVDNNQGGKP